MNIKYHIDYLGGEQFRHVADLVSDSTDDQEGGSVEQALGTARNCGDALGKLVNILAEKGLLTAPEVLEIAGLSHATNASLIP